MRNDRNLLEKELRQAGAKAAEIKELLPIALKLGSLGDHQEATPLSTKKPHRWLSISQSVVFAALGLAPGVLLITFSQAAAPTSLLYPVQKFSDSVAIRMYPEYRANVMMQRAQQVNQLVANHASSGQILTTLADYTKQASVYKSAPRANYAAFEYCKTNLEQAASAASPTVKQAIANSLDSLDAT